MKKYLYSLAFAAVTMGLTSCDGTQTEPTIQWYPVVTLEGDETCYVEVGSNWTLPGFTAVNTLTGEDATSAVEVSIYDIIAGAYVSRIDTSGPGMYNVYYTSYGSMVATTPTVEKVREVFVYDPTVEADISGTWMVNADESLLISLSTGAVLYTFQEYAEARKTDGNIAGGIPIRISQVLPGFFYVDDLDAGLIDLIIGYGPNNPSFNFQLHAYISLNSDNEISQLTGTFGYAPWQGNYSLTNFMGQYDPENDVITYTADMPGFGAGLDVILERP